MTGSMGGEGRTHEGRMGLDWDEADEKEMRGHGMSRGVGESGSRGVRE